MPDQSIDAASLAALLAALGAQALPAAERDRLLDAARQVRDDARRLEALDLDGVEPEARPDFGAADGEAS